MGIKSQNHSSTLKLPKIARHFNLATTSSCHMAHPETKALQKKAATMPENPFDGWTKVDLQHIKGPSTHIQKSSTTVAKTLMQNVHKQVFSSPLFCRKKRLCLSFQKVQIVPQPNTSNFFRIASLCLTCPG